MPRVPLRQGDLVVGEAAKWDVFDPQGKLLLERGALVESEQAANQVLRSRGLRELDMKLSNDEMGMLSRRKSDDMTERGVRMPFEETRIKPGDALQLQDSNGGERMGVRLIGYQRGKSVIVTNPVQHGSSIFLRVGTTFVARAFSGQLAFAFSASVLANPVKPYPYVHLSYPGDVIGIKVRRGERVKLRVVTAFELDNGKTGSGVISNLSVGGAQLLTPSTDIAIGGAITLKFKLLLGGMEYLLQIAGVVRANVANPDEPDLGAGYGLQFNEISPEDVLIISAFVFQQLVDNKSS